MSVSPPPVGPELAAHLPGDDWNSARLVDDIEASTVGGKAIRSGLFVAVHRALGGPSGPVEDDVAAAIEWLHEALLAHDDVADDDTVRRGVPNVMGRALDRGLASGLSDTSARHLGVVAGILAGDVLLVLALTRLARIDAPAPVRHALSAEVERALLVTVHGEYEDVHRALVAREPDPETSLAIARAKTAEYSVALPLVAGSILGGATAATTDALRAVGGHLGTAYQLADDVLGVFGDSTATGKSVSSDLDRRAPTYLLADAAAQPEWDEIDRALGVDPDRARDLLYSCGSRRRTLDRAAAEVARAREILSGADVPGAVAEALESFIATAVDRIR